MAPVQIRNSAPSDDICQPAFPQGFCRSGPRVSVDADFGRFQDQICSLGDEPVPHALRRLVNGFPAKRNRKTRSGRVRRLGLEGLEDRRLLASTPLSLAQQDSLNTGITALADFGRRLGTTAEISTAIPLTDVSVGETADLHSLFGSALAQPVIDYLNTTGEPTSPGIANALNASLSGPRSDGLDIVSALVSDASTSDELSVVVQFEARRQSDITFDLETELAGSPIAIDTQLAAHADTTFFFDATFGLRSSGDASVDTFYVDFNSGNRLETVIDFNQQGAPLSAHMGLLGVTISGAELNFEYGAELNFQLQDIDATGLQFAPVADLVEISPGNGSANAFSFRVPIAVDLAGVALPAYSSITFADSDLFDGQFDVRDPGYVSNDAADLSSFQNVSPEELLGGLTQLRSLVHSLGESEAFDRGLPFTAGARLLDVLQLGEAIDARLLERLRTPDAGNEPNFQSIQQLSAKIASAVRYENDAIDGPTLLIDLGWTAPLAIRSVPLDFTLDTNELNQVEVDASAELSVEVDVTADFELGLRLRKPGADFEFQPATPLSALNRGMGVTFASGNDVRLTLRDGTVVDVDLSGQTTVGQIAAAVAGAVPVMGSVEVQIDSEQKRFVIIDHTTGSNSELRIEKSGDSLAVFALGIAGSSDIGRLEGAPLHGETIADLISIRQGQGPMLKAAARLLADRVSATGRLGFAEIGIVDGSVSAQIDSTLRISDLGEIGGFTDKIVLTDAVEALASGLVRPQLSGAADLDLPLAIGIGGPNAAQALNVSGVVLPAAPRLTMNIPDLLRDDLGAPGSVSFDFSRIGDLTHLRNLSLSDIITALRGGLDYLAQLETNEAVGVLNDDLGLLGVKLSDVVHVADRFTEILTALESRSEAGLRGAGRIAGRHSAGAEDPLGSNPNVPDFAVFTIPELNAGKTFQFNGNLIDLADRTADIAALTGGQFATLEEFLISLQRDTPAIEVSLDVDGPQVALRIDLMQTIAEVTRQVPLNIDLADLGIPGLTDLIDLTASSLVDLAVAGTMHMSLGLDLTNPSNVRPFLYDVLQNGQGGLTGTRLELTTSAIANDLNLSATAGALGVAINGGTIALTNATGNGPAAIAVGLANDDGNGRHDFSEFSALFGATRAKSQSGGFGRHVERPGTGYVAGLVSWPARQPEHCERDAPRSHRPVHDHGGRRQWRL